MPRFLHVADVHLGFDHYDSRERTRDFFLAFEDVLQKYAIGEQVDFILIAGDLFEHRTLQPAILNQAKTCLLMLKEAGIPAIAIEGNHDNRPYGTTTNWLRYLADDGLLILLEPEAIEGQVIYEPWDETDLCGGYVDLPCGVRILGSQWYGSAAPKLIPTLADALRQLPPAPGPTILMLHHGLEGQIARYQGALQYRDLLPLQQAGVDYLALGHIHKHYQEGNWIFNPGSIEANSIEESTYDRGALLVEISPSGIQAALKQDYYQRPIVRLKLKTTGQETLEEVEQKARAIVQSALQDGRIDPADRSIVELRIEGTVGFERLDLDVRQLQTDLQAISQALIFLLRYNVDAIAYETPLSEDASRLHIEQEIFTDIFAAQNAYKHQAASLAQGLIELKTLQMQDYPDADLYNYVQQLLDPA